MTNHNVKVLPARPWKLTAGFALRRMLGGLIAVLAGIGAIIGYTYMEGSELRLISDNEAVWHMPGAIEGGADVKGRVSSRLFFDTYTLEVTYDTDAGARTEKLEFGTIGDIDKDASPMVRFDPNNPKRYALNWAVEATGKRWASGIILLIVGDGLIGGVFLFIGVMAFVQLARSQRAAREGVELHAQLLSATEQLHNGRATGNMTYSLRLPSRAQDPDSPFDEPVTTDATIRKANGGPLTAPTGVVVIVATDATPKRPAPLVVRSDLYPLDVSADERQSILDRCGRS